MRKNNTNNTTLRLLEICKNNNFSLLHFEYVNNKSKLNLKCNICNHEWFFPYDKFNDKSICKKCAGFFTTQEEAEIATNNICKLKNYNIKPFIYIDTLTELHLHCNNCNNEWTTTYRNLVKKKRGCKICGYNKNKNLHSKVESEINNICTINNYTLEPFDYINNNTYNIHLTCNTCNHTWFTNYRLLLYSKRRCKQCYHNSLKLQQYYVDEMVNNICELKDYKLVKSFEYVKNNTKNIELICKYNHTWISSYQYLSHGFGCPTCNQSKLEFKISKLFEKYNIIYISQYRTKWLRKQTLDFFLPEYNIAIECQGAQHFKSVEYFGGDKKFKSVLKLDQHKFELCESNDITVLYYSDYTNLPTEYYSDIYTNVLELLNIIKLFHKNII